MSTGFPMSDLSSSGTSRGRRRPKRVVSPRCVLLSGLPVNLQQPPMVVYHSVNPRHLKFQLIGDKQWKTIQHTTSLTEVIACNGRFYGFTSNELYSVDLQANNRNGTVVQLLLDLPYTFTGVPPPHWKFMADFSGDLIVMCSHNERELFLKVENGTP
ncbi:hypothetical protein J5N97_025685 [Dioscorea zingiberensis]|uniref:Uncharacterized protein n=1 Tax=Dioscorea zingiberensis TaxID=325984 RepID=A0A9D5H681_9LILI|nr:hypothetical protein J5N97_025685 [Dioscorea zingiberensis]